jgi:hypothetical protein
LLRGDKKDLNGQGDDSNGRNEGCVMVVVAKKVLAI